MDLTQAENDALDLALEEVVWARQDDPDLSDADLWTYGRSRYGYWLQSPALRQALRPVARR